MSATYSYITPRRVNLLMIFIGLTILACMCDVLDSELILLSSVKCVHSMDTL